MAHGTLREFDVTKESIEDFRQRFEFYCLANNIKNGDEAQRNRKKALFITLLGQTTFANLRDLASPREITDISLDEIIDLLKSHYRPQTVEIAERFKFFKRAQGNSEQTTDFMAALRRLAKTCNFGQYLETALRDQFVCGLRDEKCQRELLSIQDLTATIALQKATAAEAICKETQTMQEIRGETTTAAGGDVYKLLSKTKCYRCGKSGHHPSNCKFKNARCYSCQKTGHVASVCQSKKPGSKSARPLPPSSTQEIPIKHQGVCTLQEKSDSNSDSSDLEQLHAILQLGTKSNKFVITVQINKVPIEMEVDSGAERSTVPLSVFQQKLADVCELQPSSVSLHQYDKSPLAIAGECQATVQVNNCVIKATYVVVEVEQQLPLLGRDWMALLKFDVVTIMNQVTQVHHTSEDPMTTEIKTEFADVFKEELGLLKGIEASVTVDESAPPRFHKPRPVPFALKEKVEHQLDKQVEDGELIPVNKSEWAAPIVVVRKPDGGLRICGDFKVSINPFLHPQTYPLPTPEEIFSTLANGESYTKLDLARAYKQMKVKEDCQPLLTINTHRGLFQYTRLPFGITTAPSLWQRAMAQVLSGLSGVVYYIDDILVTGRTREEHITNLRAVLQRIREHGLRLKESKCQFFTKELEFLGHNISPQGVKPTNSRVKSIVEAPAPTNKQELQSFLGMLTYNSKFLPNMSHTLHPLNQLLRKNTPWVWKTKQQRAFEAAKCLLSQTTALAHYDVKRALKLYCDASANGVGACLVHVMDDNSEKPVAYASRTLTKSEVAYAQIEREALALVFGVRRFHQYLYGRPFMLVTDHRPLCKIFGSKEGIPTMAAARMQRWAITLSAYQYTIEHIKGTSNQCADCMSRLPMMKQSRDSAEKIHIVVQTNDLPVTASKIAKETVRDSQLSIVMKAIRYGRWPTNSSVDVNPFYKRRHELSIVDGCILWGTRVVIPKTFHRLLLQELHCSHLGMSRMKSLARSYFWWPRLDSEIEELSRNCVECTAASRNPPKAPAHPWIVPQHPWQRIHVDHAQFGKYLLLVTVDAYSKWPEVHVVSSTSAQATIDKLRMIFATHGLPITLVSDNGPPFQSAEFHKFMTGNGITHRHVPPYHPSSNGLAENMVKTVKEALSKCKITKDATIETHIARFLASYRNTCHSTTSRTPAELLFNRVPRTRLSLVHPCTSERIEQATENNMGDHQPRHFSTSSKVMIRDLRPNAPEKWRKGTITKVLGPLNYEVDINGYFRQAHIDHILPCPQTLTDPVDSLPVDVPTQVDDEIIMPIVSPDSESCELDTGVAELVTPRAHRKCGPPKRLIEEIN